MEVGKLSTSLHEGVGDRHGSNDHDIHEKREQDDLLIESNKLVVLGETIADKVTLDSFQEVPVERRIDNQV